MAWHELGSGFGGARVAVQDMNGLTCFRQLLGPWILVGSFSGRL